MIQEEIEIENICYKIMSEYFTKSTINYIYFSPVSIYLGMVIL